MKKSDRYGPTERQAADETNAQHADTKPVSEVGGGVAAGFPSPRWRVKANQSLTSPPPNHNKSVRSANVTAGPTTAMCSAPTVSAIHRPRQSGSTVASLLRNNVQSTPWSRACFMPALVAAGNPTFSGSSITTASSGAPARNAETYSAGDPLSTQISKSGGVAIAARLRSAASVSFGGPQLTTRPAVFSLSPGRKSRPLVLRERLPQSHAGGRGVWVSSGIVIHRPD